MCLENNTLKALNMNENSKTGYTFGTNIPKPVEDKGILWTLYQVEVTTPRVRLNEEKDTKSVPA